MLIFTCADHRRSLKKWKADFWIQYTAGIHSRIIWTPAEYGVMEEGRTILSTQLGAFYYIGPVWGVGIFFLEKQFLKCRSILGNIALPVNGILGSFDLGFWPPRRLQLTKYGESSEKWNMNLLKRYFDHYWLSAVISGTAIGPSVLSLRPALKANGRHDWKISASFNCKTKMGI